MMNKMTKKILIFGIIILIIIVGVLIYFKKSTAPTNLNPISQHPQLQERIGIIQDIALSAKVITIEETHGNWATGELPPKGKEINLALTDATMFYDKNGNKVDISFFKRGMWVTARGELTNETSLIPEWVKELPSPGAEIEYRNTDYGFSVSLPESWLGYSIVKEQWQGYQISDKSGEVLVEQGLQILLRHHQWTSQRPRQDIPIMVFTLSQWNSLLRGKFYIGAAPINPSRLGFNANYVLALPARYNVALPTGWEDVQKILEGDPLQPLQPLSAISADDKTLICGGIPNGSTQNITETTRLFINLPRDVYLDKDHNLQFKTVSGNATAGWISNAGPYGEAFESNSDCWSYYYEFDGRGEVELTVKNGLGSAPDYFVRFIVGSTQ